jgi:hypothetical protein
MPCVAALLALISPRLAIFVLWIFDDLLGQAFDSWVLPVVGFFLLPWTTLVYALMYEVGTSKVSGFEWFIVVLAFLGDLSTHGSSWTARERRERGA